ncbi:hypothetical protein Lepto7375DRAFT_7061 [Leptolyngbya sp. PCC 7375]|nr:hypothetical protein Lepto7375DRAFT_7061 [Leptolyngbya sp. PCC 7375]
MIRASVYTKLLCSSLGALLASIVPTTVPTAEAQAVSQLNSIVRRLLDNDDEDPPLISRGDLCIIAPATAGEGTPAIWHEQPVIVFKPGSIEKLALRDEATNEVFWEYIPASTTSHLMYSGEPLQSDTIYRLEVYLDADAENPAKFPDFRLLPEDFRQQISNELASNTVPKDTDLLSEDGVATEDWVAIQHAEYFADQGLRLDAIQALFNVNTPSAELATMQQQIIEAVCSR